MVLIQERQCDRCKKRFSTAEKSTYLIVKRLNNSTVPEIHYDLCLTCTSTFERFLRKEPIDI